LYRLVPRSVIVDVSDISSRPILPKLPGSEFPSPAVDLTKQMKGMEIDQQVTKGLSKNQKSIMTGGKSVDTPVVRGTFKPRVRQVKLKFPISKLREPQ